MKKVNVTIPVYNEENKLTPSIERLIGFLKTQKDFKWEVVIADNGSRDNTLSLAKDLASSIGSSMVPIKVSHCPEAGRGRALRRVWLGSDADILTYMDVDLSTGLEALPVLVNLIASGNAHVVTGSRLSLGSRTRRSIRREIISRVYNFLVRLIVDVSFTDTQCGFKGVDRCVAEKLLPMVTDNDFFFDTELLVKAKSRGYRVLELPVEWVENPDSRVHIYKTTIRFIKGLYRLRKEVLAK